MAIRRIAVLLFAAALLAVSALTLNAFPAGRTALPDTPPPEITGVPDDTEETAAVKAERLRLAFSQAGGFYEESIEISIISSIPDAKIYYTTDGSEPTSASEEYSEPLSVETLDRVNTLVLKAIAVHDDFTTRPLVQTYFVGGDIDSRFDTLVFSISTDDEHLYDYDTGIFVEGRLRDDYIRDNPRGRIDPPAPANFNLRGREGERPVYVEVFTPEGDRVIAQAAGLRVQGGWSRAETQKSLRLIARSEYEPDAGKFHYDFFSNDDYSDYDPILDSYGTPLRKFDTLVLRNGANDRNFAMLRNEVASKLARDAGFNEVTPVRAASVFVNGEYYGFAWLIVTVNEQYLQDKYEAPTKNFDIIGDGDQWYRSENTRVVEDLKVIDAEYSRKNLLDDRTFAELEALIDIDNLLLYYAFEIYMGNDDWPNNNLKRWRYTGPQVDGLAPELDGRWRYIMYDLDWTLGLYGDDYRKATFRTVIGGSKNSPLLSAILKRPDMAEKFTVIMCDLTSNVITEDAVASYIASLYGEAANELDAAFAAHKYANWTSLGNVFGNHDAMKAFARRRGEYIRENLTREFGYAGAVSITVTGGEAVIGTQRGTSAVYFPNMTIPLSPALDKHTVFDHWIIDGNKLYEPDITISTDNVPSGAVNVTLVTRYEPPPLIFSDAYASSQRNGCVLLNTGTETVNTSGLYLSNDIDNLFRWEFPAAKVEPGETLTLAGKGSADKKDLRKIQMGFNARQGNILYLSDESGTLLDYIICK
ncbi:MAG: CotH kinase family protein [Oscillospiraceae bacterium]|nr:CotH kinase family protein [Oscillospiraceae bacterium]